MAFDTLLDPVTLYALLALGMGASAYLFLTLKKELRALETRFWRRQNELEKMVQDLDGRLQRARVELKEAGEQTALAAAPAGPLEGMNFTKRSQALRLLRRGQGPEHVAAALHLP
ncbi:MAG: hypothetical protein ACREEC_10160, partial [Thermoplasmata archaeon]